MKKSAIVSSVITLCCLIFSINTAYADALANFKQVNSYSNSVFSDVGAGEWYSDYVSIVYEYGIMSGVGDGEFNPSGNISVAEAITIAARLNSTYYGNTIGGLNGGYSYNFKSGNIAEKLQIDSDDTGRAYAYDEDIGGADLEKFVATDEVEPFPKGIGEIEYGGGFQKVSGNGYVTSSISWALPYIYYAAEQGIISATEFSGRYSMPASKEELAALLYRALPESYPQINDISPIPDVKSENKYYSEILNLYEAGVLTGDDEYGTFRPGSYTKRSEVAAMVARVVRPDLRRTFSLNSNVPFVSISHSWQYPAYSGATYYMTLQMNAADVEYFKALPRTYDYASYASDYADYTYMSSLANNLKNMAIENGITDDYSIAEFITAFVQNLEYQDDLAYTGALEYPKYPMETLYDHGGDCEDTAALLVRILDILGYGAVLLESDNHMAVGLQTSGEGNISYEGNHYYYIETTGAGWRIGEVPDDMVGERIRILYV